MRVVFLGTPALAVPTLAAVADRHEVLAVVCQPDRPQGRHGTPAPPPVKSWALAHGLPVHQPTKLNDGTFEAWLQDLAPDAGIVFAYGRILQRPIIDIPKHGWLNVHPSLLPRWRGPSPIQSAILHGDTVTGVTIMRLVFEMDAGDIVLQEDLPIGADETADELTERVAPIGARMMCEALDQVAAGTAVYRPQGAEGITHCTMLTKEHGHIQWHRPAGEIHNQVRACAPWPAAQCRFRDGICKILRTSLADAPATRPPGTIEAIEKDRVLVATGDGLLAITVFQVPGKKPLPMGDFARGARLQPGERFEDAA